MMRLGLQEENNHPKPNSNIVQEIKTTRAWC
ncbi:hypothetical protein LINPERPRIM_LOCUS5883 [Linum perenne]